MNILIILAIVIGITLAVFCTIDRRQSKGSKSDSTTNKTSKVEIPGRSSYEEDVVDYLTYVMSSREKILYTILAAGIIFVFGYIFYNNLIVSAILMILAYFYPRIRSKQLAAKRREDFTIQFKQALYSLSTSLAAGRSVENAFKEVGKDLSLIYPDPKTYIIREIGIINYRVENGQPIEEPLLDLSARAGIEEISNFTDVFITCKRKGGNLNDVIRRTSDIIGDKLDIKQDIAVMIAQKRFESKIMILAPFAIVLLLNYSAPDYMAPIYSIKTGGPIIMTVALITLGLVYWWTENIMDIKV